MIAAGPATRVFLVSGATDMRKGFDGLAALVRSRLGEEPLSGHLFAFANASRTPLKNLFWDGSGLWVCSKRLERARFHWPTLEGVDGARHKPKNGNEIAWIISQLSAVVQNAGANGVFFNSPSG